MKQIEKITEKSYVNPSITDNFIKYKQLKHSN